MNLLARLEALPRSLVIGASAALALLIGVVDFVTGYQFSLSPFYLLPILLFAWIGGRRLGYAGAVFSAAVRTLVDLFGGPPYPSVLYPVWNTVMRLILFFFAALTISTLRTFVDLQRSLARTDHLTGAVNKRAFEELLAAEIDRSRRYLRPFTLAYFDLDNFKTINDTFGHSEGDRLLQTVTRVMRAHMRASDTIARLGGDEFCLLLPEADESAARSAISKIKGEFAVEMEARRWPVTLSIGSLTCVPDGQDVHELIMTADRLMYSAKMQGKDRVQFASMQPTSGHRG